MSKPDSEPAHTYWHENLHIKRLLFLTTSCTTVMCSSMERTLFAVINYWITVLNGLIGAELLIVCEVCAIVVFFFLTVCCLKGPELWGWAVSFLHCRHPSVLFFPFGSAFKQVLCICLVNEHKFLQHSVLLTRVQNAVWEYLWGVASGFLSS